MDLIDKLKKDFSEIYNSEPDVIIRSPGRAEIIGNHTDYNNGYALAAAITDATFAALKKRNDGKIRVISKTFKLEQPIEFSLTQIAKDDSNNWSNYVRGIVKILLNQNFSLTGADIFLTSSVPISGGLSSSAALEVAIAKGMLELHGYEIDPLKLAELCQKAENEFVGSPCGLLDQASVVFAKENNLVFLDFLPDNSKPLSQIKNIPFKINDANLSLVVIVDKNVKRELGESGYPERRKMCEESIPFWKESLGREIKSLRDITSSEFNTYKESLKTKNPKMCMRVEHIVFENERVLNSIKALNSEDYTTFGKLLTESGKSALELYELDEETPELTFIFRTGKTLPGVRGIRNMGGGFSALALALVDTNQMSQFKENLASAYSKQFAGTLNFIPFQAAEGASLC